MDENNIGEIVLGCAIKAPIALGPGPLSEVKAVDKPAEIHRAQRLSYLKLGGYRLGYPLNFNVPRMKDGIIRMASNL